MSESQPLEAIIEAILLVATDPVSLPTLAKVIEMDEAEIERSISNLEALYRGENRGFSVMKVEDGYRLYSKPEYHDYLRKYSSELGEGRLSGAALETLAIVGYQQPISRAGVSIIRGVNSDQVMRLLAVKGYISTVGRDSGPGSAQLFGTTTMFLERLGLNSLSDLPPLGGFAPGIEIAEAFENSLREDS